MNREGRPFESFTIFSSDVDADPTDDTLSPSNGWHLYARLEPDGVVQNHSSEKSRTGMRVCHLWMDKSFEISSAGVSFTYRSPTPRPPPKSGPLSDVPRVRCTLCVVLTVVREVVRGTRCDECVFVWAVDFWTRW